MIPVAGHSKINLLDQRQQAALSLAGLRIRVHLDFELMLGSFGADAVQRFVILRIGVSSDGIAYTCFGHQITFIRRINEHFGAINPSILHPYLSDARAILLHCGQSLLKIHRRFGFIDHREKHILSDVRLERPHRGIARVEVGCDWARVSLLKILFPRLKPPRVIASVVFSDAMIEFPRDASNRCLVADVRGAQAAGSQSPEVIPKLGYHNRFSHPARLDRCRCSRSRPAVNANVRLNNLHCRGRSAD